MRWLSLTVLLLTSCLANKANEDGGVLTDAGMNAACSLAGGQCLQPAACAEEIGDIGCGSSGAICCSPIETVSTTVVTDGATASTRSDATVVPVDASTSAATKIAPGCSTSCETTCEGDPICIQNCGC